MTEHDKNEERRTIFSSPDGRERVVHLTTAHAPFDPRVFHKQLVTLAEAGYDAHLIVPHNEVERRKGISIHPLPEPADRRQRLALQPLLFQKARALGADLYQFHDPELIPLAFLLKKITGTPVVYDMHEDYRSKGPFLGRALRLLERWCFRWIDHVLFAEKSYHSIVENCDVDCTYIANYFKPIGEAPLVKREAGSRREGQPFQLIYTGTLSDQRGLRTMLDLAGAIREQGREETINLVGICRSSDQRARAEERIRGKELDPIVNRVGWETYVSPKEMPPYYHQADIGLALLESHPNYVGSLPTKFYEYLHYDLPIICSDFPLWRKFIEKHECGEVVPPGNVEAVIDVLTEWRSHPNRYCQYKENTRQAAQQYQWKEMGKRLVDIYQTILREG